MASPDRPREMSNLRILGTATGMTLTVIAWGVLVFAAIDFGRSARDGSNRDWLYLVIAAVLAIGCMFGAIMLGARMQAMMRAAQRSSTRPLAQPLTDLPPLAEQPGTPAVRASGDGSRPARNPNAGKRAARR